MGFVIIGAGMAGLFAAAALREDAECILEAQPSLPDNHQALLRFRTDEVGRMLNISFKSVSVLKTVDSIGNPAADAISYSVKTLGEARLRSIISANGVWEDRFVAPSDFVERLRAKVSCDIDFNTPWAGGPFQARRPGRGCMYAPIISTIPMPALMRALKYSDFPNDHGTFRSVTGYVIQAELKDTDVYATVYIPARSIDGDPVYCYRASITGSRLIVEYAFPGDSAATAEEKMRPIVAYPFEQKKHLDNVLSLFGLDDTFIKGKPTSRPQRFMKLLPIPEEERKRFIMWASERHGVYSFGRFATWRPGLLMDHLPHDLQVIQSLADGAPAYEARKKTTRRVK